MNKKFIYAALASLAMVGCAKTEGVKPVKQAETITFRTTNTSATRAETTLQNLKSFVSVTFATPKVIDNYMVFPLELSKPVDGSNTWDSGYFWPGDNPIQSFNIGPVNDFIKLANTLVYTKETTVYDKAKNAGLAEAEAANVYTTVNMGGADGHTPSATYKQVAKKNDNRNINKGVDVVIGTTLGEKNQQNQGVLPLDFKHIYSQVCISAANKSSKYTVKVLGAAIANVNSEGTFNFPITNTVQATALTAQSASKGAAWSDVNTSVVYGNAWNKTAITNTGGTEQPAATAAPLTLTSTAVDVLHPTASQEGIYLIPQVLTCYNLTDKNDNGTYLKVFVQISSTAQGTQLFPNTPDKFGSVLIPIAKKGDPAKELLAGHKYKFIINFFSNDKKPNGGYADPHPADNGTDKGTPGDKKRTGGGDPTTTDGDGNNPDIVSDPTNKKPGEPVISTETIKFNVSIDPWTEDSTITIDL